jgi:hypothetical protein
MPKKTVEIWSSIPGGGKSLARLRKLTDRELAVVGAGLIDLALLEVLSLRLLKDEKEIDKFIGSSAMAPLGTLSARTQAAYLLGLLSREHLLLIKEIKDLRNSFAHTIEFSLSCAEGVTQLKRIAQAYSKAFVWSVAGSPRNFLKDVEEPDKARGFLMYVFALYDSFFRSLLPKVTRIEKL